MPLNFVFTDGRRDVPSARFKSHAVTTFCRSAFERAVASESVFPAKSSRVPSARLKCRTVGLLYRNALEGGVAELPGISDPVFPTKSSSVPLARLKSLSVDLLYRVALEACQRHAATFRAGNHKKPEFCNSPATFRAKNHTKSTREATKRAKGTSLRSVVVKS